MGRTSEKLQHTELPTADSVTAVVQMNASATEKATKEGKHVFEINNSLLVCQFLCGTNLKSDTKVLYVFRAVVTPETFKIPRYTKYFLEFI